MKKRSTILWIVGVILAISTASMLTKQDFKDEHVIGLVLPITGRFANISEDVLRGIEIFKNHIPSLNILIEDSAGEASKAVSALTNLLHTKNADVILSGPGGSTSNLAMSPVANKSAIPLVTISSTAALREKDDYIFTTLPSVDAEVHTLVQYVMSKNIKTAAVIFDPTSDTQSTGAKTFTDIFTKLGGTVTLSEGYGKDVDYRTISKKLTQGKPDMIYILAIDKIAGPFVKQLREQKYDGLLTGFSAAESVEFLKSAGEATENFILSALAFSCERTTETKNYCSEYRSRFGIEPTTVYSAYTYDSLQYIYGALNTCSGDLKNCLIEQGQLQNSLTEGFGLDSNGDLQNTVPIKIKKVVGGKFVEVK